MICRHMLRIDPNERSKPTEAQQHVFITCQPANAIHLPMEPPGYNALHHKNYREVASLISSGGSVDSNFDGDSMQIESSRPHSQDHWGKSAQSTLNSSRLKLCQMVCLLSLKVTLCTRRRITPTSFKSTMLCPMSPYIHRGPLEEKRTNTHPGELHTVTYVIRYLTRGLVVALTLHRPR